MRTVQPDEGFDGKAFTGDGPAINSSNDEISLDGLGVAEAKSTIIDWLEGKGLGERTINYRLRDWLLSRQRYWGAPIPIIHCPACGEVPVPDDQLPVELPDLRGRGSRSPKGVSPLASARDWVEVACPKCGGPAERDTDTMDTFVDSSWYFLRYLSPEYTEGAFDPEAARRWMPTYQYVGGKEHAVLHLLYARFFVKALHDMGLLEATEPFTRLLNQGQVINEGKAMSKSLGNGVNLGDQLDEFGVDAVRLTMVFAGPPDDDIDWADMSPGGSLKFLQRAWRLSGSVESPVGVDSATGDLALRKTHPPHGGRRDRADRLVPVQRDDRPGDGAGERHPQGDRLRSGCGRPGGPRGGRDGGDPAEPGGAVHGRGHVGEPGPRADGRQGRLAEGRPGAAGRGLGDRRRPDRRQGEGPAGGRRRDITDADLEQLALASEAVQKALDGRGTRKVIVRAPKLVNIVPA